MATGFDWKKSSRSGANNNCVEVRTDGTGYQVRDTKLGEDSPILDVSLSEFAMLREHLERE